MIKKATKNNTEYRLNKVFSNRIKDIEVIFDSYRLLYDVYIGVMETSGVNGANLAAFARCKPSVDKLQRSISTKLHTQAFILLSGSFEAFLNDIFENLIQENFLAIRKASGINYSVSDLQKILEQNEDRDFVSLGLANITIKQIQGVKNKNEKINFQNTKRMSEVFSEYFGIEIDLSAEYIKRIHKYWQMRHAIVHTNSVVDERYVNNVKKGGLESEALGSVISITKNDYRKVKDDISSLLSHIEDELVRLKLSFDGIDMLSKADVDGEADSDD